MSGLTADARTLVDHARVEAQAHLKSQTGSKGSNSLKKVIAMISMGTNRRFLSCSFFLNVVDIVVSLSACGRKSARRIGSHTTSACPLKAT